jgi:hypothetical protein
MTLAATREVITAPVRTPHRYGLFSVLDFGGLGARPGVQLAWDSLGVTVLQVREDSFTVAGASDDNLTSTINAGGMLGGTTAFTVISHDDRSMLRQPLADDGTYAEQRLVVGEQEAVERKLTAQLEAATPTDVSVAAGAGTSPETQARVALGEVETALGGRLSEGLILVRRSVVSLIPDCFQQTGSILRTRLGTPVAACAGWTPSDSSLMFGLTALVGVRSQINRYSGPDEATNTRSNVASRDYSLGWETGLVSALPAAT